MGIIEEVQSGLAVFDWVNLVSEYQGYVLTMSVSADALKFPVVDGNTGGTILVRKMLTAEESQKIDDVLGCMPTTPKIEDLISKMAQITIAPITQIDGDICAVSTDVRHSELVDQALAKCSLPEDAEPPYLINTIGKSWVITNALANSSALKYGVDTACNYGWNHPSSGYAAVTSGMKVWQPPGYQHNKVHKDPSQTKRILFRMGNLQEPSGVEREVDLHDIAQDAALAPLISHEGVLKVLRMPFVPAPTGVIQPDGSVLLAPLMIYGRPSKRERRIS